MTDGGAAQPPRPGPEHERLAPFVGRWRTAGQVLASASSPALEIAGIDEYEWMPGGYFLLHRVDVRIGSERVQALEIIGYDAERGTYFMRSFDSQGGAAGMHASVRDGTWRFEADAERFTGAFRDDGDTLSGRWERREGDRWLPWMDVRLTKSTGSAAGGAYVDAGGLEVWYTEQGQGPPLILVHGGLATGEMWNERVIAELAREYRVLVPDSRGHGRTGNPAGTLGYDQMADDVAAFAAALGLERPLVAGYSDGAQIALELGLRHPGFARAMVIGGVVTRPSEAYLEMVRGLGFPQRGAVDLEEVRRAMGDWWDTLRTAHHHAQGDDALRAYLTQISELWYGVPDYTDAQLASLSAPSLVIAGDRDHPALDDSLRLYRLLPHGELAIVPDADHGAAEKSIFWELVKDFLSRHRDEKDPIDA